MHNSLSSVSFCSFISTRTRIPRTRLGAAYSSSSSSYQWSFFLRYAVPLEANDDGDACCSVWEGTGLRFCSTTTPHVTNKPPVRTQHAAKQQQRCNTVVVCVVCRLRVCTVLNKDEDVFGREWYKKKKKKKRKKIN